IARSYSRSGNIEAAEKEFDRYAREYPRDSKAAESLWINALNFERRGELLKASEAYQKVADKPAPNEYRDRALFKVGFCLYKNDYLTKSSIYFKELQQKHTGSNLAIQAAFWEAKAYDKLNKSDQALAIYKKLAERKERNYYVIISRERLGENIQIDFDSDVF
ncbi:tol-pal system YbgF family protein, partial [candidate division KSB1 bacterium]